MKCDVKNGITAICADLGKKIVNKGEYEREISGEKVLGEMGDSMPFVAGRYTELILGRNDSADRYVEIDE